MTDRCVGVKMAAHVFNLELQLLLRSLLGTLQQVCKQWIPTREKYVEP
jgi:hypothetical protein